MGKKEIKTLEVENIFKYLPLLKFAMQIKIYILIRWERVRKEWAEGQGDWRAVTALMRVTKTFCVDGHNEGKKAKSHDNLFCM